MAEALEKKRKKKARAANKLEKKTGVDIPDRLAGRYKYGSVRFNAFKPSILRELTERGVLHDESEGIVALIVKLKSNEGNDNTFEPKASIVRCDDDCTSSVNVGDDAVGVAQVAWGDVAASGEVDGEWEVASNCGD